MTVLDPKKVNIKPEIMNCVFIGYAYNKNTYQFLIYKSNIKSIYPSTIMKSRNATSLKMCFI
jgi:hypothetical protein